MGLLGPGLKGEGWLSLQSWFSAIKSIGRKCRAHFHTQSLHCEENRSCLKAFTFCSIDALKRNKMKGDVHRDNLCAVEKIKDRLKNTANISSRAVGMHVAINAHRQRGAQLLHLVTDVSPYPKGQVDQ